MIEKWRKLIIPDTNQGEGEATPYSLSQLGLDLCEWDVCRCTDNALCKQHAALDSARELQAKLNQRVKVLEEALGKIVRMENLTFAECSDAEEIIYTANVALDLQCSNCGDDGEEPSKNCPTCKGTGFKCLK